MTYSVRRTLRLPCDLDRQIEGFGNRVWAENARELLRTGLVAQRADAVVRHEMLAHGERIVVQTSSERLAQHLARLLNQEEPIQLPSGDYVVVIEV